MGCTVSISDVYDSLLVKISLLVTHSLFTVGLCNQLSPMVKTSQLLLSYLISWDFEPCFATATSGSLLN